MQDIQVHVESVCRAAKDYHRFYICEITEVLVKEA